MENLGRGMTTNYSQSEHLSHLIEPGVRGFLHKTLNECRKFNDRHSDMLFMYKGKLTKEEIDLKNRQTHEYVISKIHKFSHNRTGEFNV